MTINSLNDLQSIYNRQYTKEVSDSIERIDTGLKINRTADNPAAAIISSSLRTHSSGLLQSIENANSGFGLIEVSNRALNYQEEILNKIKDQLTTSQNQDDTQREFIRSNIQSLLDEFDNIASSTSYNNNYSLQESQTNNATSTPVSINFTINSNVTTPSIRSNSEGVDLTDLKNLTNDELTSDVISTELTNIDTAINSINDFKADFSLSKEALEISVTNLTSIEQGTKKAELDLIQADINKEEVIFDKYKLLLDTSEYSIVQANLRQEEVLNLLTTLPEYQLVPKEDKVISQEDEFNIEKEDNFSFENTTDSINIENSSTNNSDNISNNQNNNNTNESS